MSEADILSAERAWNDRVIAGFRDGQELIADTFPRPVLLLLHTTGARTGQPRVSPVAYLRDKDRYLVTASAGGRGQHPGWYHNLLAQPRVTVELWSDDAIEKFEAVATPAEGTERDTLWEMITSWQPGYADYQTQTTRQIPVVTLARTPN
jgi:deazaflavin-dependent oxidoreductase (nitroreductase family)